MPPTKRLFQAACPGVANLDDFNLGHAARAIAAYLHDNFSSGGAPFDRYLAGDLDALSEKQKRGALQFFGATRKAKCSNCHRGPALTDNAFHGLAIPQVGPRLGDRGRGPVVASATEDFKFRTPALRNVALSGPYFHDGSAATGTQDCAFLRPRKPATRSVPVPAYESTAAAINA